MAQASFGQLVDPQEEAIQRQRQYAQALRQQAMAPMEQQVVSGRVVPFSVTQGLANMLKAYAGRKGEEDADTKALELGTRKRTQGAAELQGIVEALRGKPAIPSFQTGANEMGDESVMQNPVAAQAGDTNKALALALQSQNPMAQQIGGTLLQQQLMPKNVVVGRSLLNQNTGQVVGQDATWQAEQEQARAAKAAELQAKMDDAKASRAERLEAQKEMLKLQQQGREDMMRMAASMRPAPPAQAPVAVIGPDGQPMYVSPSQAIGQRPASKTNENKLPTSALKMQQEEVEAIGTAGTISADLDALTRQIDSGKLKIGPVENLLSKGKNLAGLSDENSRNFQSFAATLEKLRNDSLRLNKGVQTEGDAVRAWNEILTNINDPQVVKQRLAEVKKINERAAGLRKMNVDLIRQNFGVQPLDTAPVQNQSPAIGAPQGQPAAPSGFKIIGVK